MSKDDTEKVSDWQLWVIAKHSVEGCPPPKGAKPKIPPAEN